MCRLFCRFVVLMVLIPQLMYAADQNKKLSGLPPDVWCRIIKSADGAAVEQLKLHGRLQIVSKSIAVQQPKLDQLDLTPADVEDLMWQLNPQKKVKTIALLVSLHLNHHVFDYKKNVFDYKKKPGLLSVDECAYYKAKQLVFDALKKNTGDVVTDMLRAECFTHPFLCHTKKSGELLLSFVKHHLYAQNNKIRNLAYYLIDVGDAVNYQDKYGATALHQAIEWYPFAKAQKNDEPLTGIVERLLERGADLTVKHPHYGTGFDHAINKATKIYFTYDAGISGEQAVQVQRDNLTYGQKIIIAGVAFSPSSDKVPQILNGHYSAHNPLGDSLSAEQITNLCKLKEQDKRAYLAMKTPQVWAYEEKMKSKCTLL